jgi:hypothetical protein
MAFLDVCILQDFHDASICDPITNSDQVCAQVIVGENLPCCPHQGVLRSLYSRAYLSRGMKIQPHLPSLCVFEGALRL